MGRRWGKTIMSGALALAAAATGNRVAWIAPTYKQSRPLWRWATSAANGVGEVSKTDRVISFDGGGFVGIYSADNYDSMRGESFNLAILDEAARIAEEAWTDVIQPTLADYDGDAILITTPRGRDWFWREWLRGKVGMRREASFTAPSNANPNPNIRAAFERAREIVSDRTFRQEWLAEFIDDGGGVFRNVRARATARTCDPIEGRQYVGGLDWALSVDYTVLTILDMQTRTVVWRDRFNGAEYSLQRERIAAAAKRYNNALIVGESNAMGKPNNDELRRMGCRVRDFTTTSTTKADIIESLAAAFERGQVTILDEPIGIAELESYESKRLAGGGVQYNAPSGMHDDTVMSLALAWSATQRTQIVWGD